MLSKQRWTAIRKVAKQTDFSFIVLIGKKESFRLDFVDQKPKKGFYFNNSLIPRKRLNKLIKSGSFSEIRLVKKNLKVGFTLLKFV